MSTSSAVLWQKNPALAWREIDDETVIISPNDSVMHEPTTRELSLEEYRWEKVGGGLRNRWLKLRSHAGRRAHRYAITFGRDVFRKLVVSVAATNGVSP
jgi:hypothetical protein